MMLINERNVFRVELTPTGYTGPRTGARTLIFFGLKYRNGIQPENIMDPCVTGVPVQYNTLGEIGVVVYTAFTGVQPLGGRHITDEQLRDLRHLSIPACPPIIEGGNDLYLIGKIMERLELDVNHHTYLNRYRHFNKSDQIFPRLFRQYRTEAESVKR
ncbi:hypothetical protein EV360DRAFT_69967 [Lentinula raphanica]|nr:hypothetical protein EV360DRAFT_69967 [Lentinula raphanica]